MKRCSGSRLFSSVTDGDVVVVKDFGDSGTGTEELSF